MSGGLPDLFPGAFVALAGEHGHEQVGEGRLDVHERLPDVEEDRPEPHAGG